jgi:hypothetical protein
MFWYEILSEFGLNLYWLAMKMPNLSTDWEKFVPKSDRNIMAARKGSFWLKNLLFFKKVYVCITND